MAFCGNCGTQLNDGAKFCSKCGNPIIQGTQTKEEDNGKKWVRYSILAIVFVAACYFIGTLGDGKSEDTTPKQQTEQALEIEKRKEQQMEMEAQRKEAEAQRKEAEAQRRRAEELRKEEELKSKIMEYTVQVQEVMTAINNKYNRYVQVGSSGPMDGFNGVNVIGDITDLKLRGDAIFDKMISLARQYNNQDILNTIQQEKKDFDAKANQMTSNINNYIYDY